MSTHPLLVIERKKLKKAENKVLLIAVICFKVYLMIFGISAAFAIKYTQLQKYAATVILTQR